MIVDFHSCLTPILSMEPLVCAWVRNWSQVLFQVYTWNIFQELIILYGNLQGSSCACARVQEWSLSISYGKQCCQDLMQNMIWSSSLHSKNQRLESYCSMLFWAWSFLQSQDCKFLQLEAWAATCNRSMLQSINPSQRHCSFEAGIHCIQSGASSCTPLNKVPNILKLLAQIGHYLTCIALVTVSQPPLLLTGAILLEIYQKDAYKSSYWSTKTRIECSWHQVTTINSSSLHLVGVENRNIP